MQSTSKRQKILVAAVVFGVIPCILGVGIGLYLRWSGIVWLTSTGWFWPTVCLVISLAVLTRRAISPFKEETAGVGAWLVVTWTWLYVPLWLMATEIPKSSAVVSQDGQVFVASDWVWLFTDEVWLLTGVGGNKIVQNVIGSTTVNSVEIEYRYDDQYIATRAHGEDLLIPLIGAATAILEVEASKPRSSRIALFEKTGKHDQLTDRVCGIVVANAKVCPLKMSLTPRSDATIPGAVWSKHYTEKEAIDERDLAALAQLLTQDNSDLVDRDRVFALFMELVVSADELAKLALKNRMLKDWQFDELIERILNTPGHGEGFTNILIEVNRLSKNQRLSLRAKVFREASIKQIIKYAALLHISDADLLQLTTRMRLAFKTNPDVAVLALTTFGQRLPPELQYDAVKAVVRAKGSHALAVLPHMNFSNKLRAQVLNKVLSDAKFEDFEAAKLSRKKLENLITPAEMRLLIARVVEKSKASPKWLDFAIRFLPVREMTPAERKSVLDGTLFKSAKSALEFVSENRNFLDSAEVNEVTHQYTRTITADFCLHLSHRNKNRGYEYFSEAQLQIFRDCAQTE